MTVQYRCTTTSTPVHLFVLEGLNGQISCIRMVSDDCHDVYACIRVANQAECRRADCDMAVQQDILLSSSTLYALQKTRHGCITFTLISK